MNDRGYERDNPRAELGIETSPRKGKRSVLKPGVNDLATKRPDIAAQWDHELNGDFNPDMVTCASHKKAWWKCKRGHKWKAIIANRTYRGSGCPYCAGEKVLAGFNDLATRRPDIAAQWDHELNASVEPNMVTVSSSRKVWWRCAKGHSWQTTVANRTKKNGSGCPYCTNRKVMPGYNDMATMFPEVAKEWDYERNGALSPDMVVAGSNVIAWWRCPKGHRWQAKIMNRTYNRNKCPECSESNCRTHAGAQIEPEQ